MEGKMTAVALKFDVTTLRGILALKGINAEEDALGNFAKYNPHMEKLLEFCAEEFSREIHYGAITIESIANYIGAAISFNDAEYNKICELYENPLVINSETLENTGVFKEVYPMLSTQVFTTVVVKNRTDENGADSVIIGLSQIGQCILPIMQFARSL